MTEEKKYADKAPETDAGSGARKNDLGKARWDLLPMDAVAKIVEIYTYGAQKYAPNQWQSLPDFEERYFAAMMRHLEAHRRGERYDKESGLMHLAHAGWGILALIWKEMQKEKEEPEIKLDMTVTPLSPDVMKFTIPCLKCLGKGTTVVLGVPEVTPITCNVCKGSGKMIVDLFPYGYLPLLEKSRSEQEPLDTTPCPHCNGTARVLEKDLPLPCPHCKGTGIVPVEPPICTGNHQ